MTEPDLEKAPEQPQTKARSRAILPRRQMAALVQMENLTQQGIRMAERAMMPALAMGQKMRQTTPMTLEPGVWQAATAAEPGMQQAATAKPGMRQATAAEPEMQQTTAAEPGMQQAATAVKPGMQQAATMAAGLVTLQAATMAAEPGTQQAMTAVKPGMQQTAAPAMEPEMALTARQMRATMPQTAQTEMRTMPGLAMRPVTAQGRIPIASQTAVMRMSPKRKTEK